MDVHTGHSSAEQTQATYPSHAIGPPAFLVEDANVTKKAFVRWFNEEFLKSLEGQWTPKAVKTVVHGLCRIPVGMAVDRESQQAEVDAILSRWEGIPLKEGSHEWSRARIRFIRDHLLTRTLGHLRRQGFKLTDPEIREARSWFRKELDGSLATYHSLPHLWKYKNLEWDFSTGNLKTVVAGVPQDSPIETRYGNAGPEGIRISRQSFQELLESNDQEKRDTVSEDDVVMADADDSHHAISSDMTTGADDCRDWEDSMLRQIQQRNR